MKMISNIKYIRCLLRFTVFVALTVCALSACGDGDIIVSKSIDVLPEIYPDYKGITVPPNIAPLNFSMADSAEYNLTVKASDGEKRLNVRSHDGLFDIPVDRWRKLMSYSKGKSVELLVSKKEGGKWAAYKPFTIDVAEDSIDSHIAYRLIPPSEHNFLMGIYQRDLESYKQEVVFENKLTDYNCINCHSFPQQSPSKMMFHLRAKQANGTAIIDNGKTMKVNTKTPETISSMVYPSWHPSGKFIAASDNIIFQSYYLHSQDRVEVYDSESDIVVYDIEKNKLITCPQLFSKDALETMPTFSPDGKSLYFCSAAAYDSIQEDIEKLKYSLCRIDFDAETRTFGTTVDTIYNANTDGRSISFPRISPDGRIMVVSLMKYGNFSINHRDADLYAIDLTSGEMRNIEEINSDNVESYHSWSSNSRWMIFSSRRGDGLYTQPFITYVDRDGRFSKPFLLPQKNPLKHYRDIMFAYNLPEFVKGRVDVNGHEIATVMAGDAVNPSFELK